MPYSLNCNLNILFSNSMAGFIKYSQKVANEYSHSHPKIPLIDAQIFTPQLFSKLGGYGCYQVAFKTLFT